MEIKEAISALDKAMQSDPDYAWSWHCNIAMAMQDEGVDREKANKGAARFMQLAFGVDTGQIAERAINVKEKR